MLLQRIPQDYESVILTEQNYLLNPAGRSTGIPGPYRFGVLPVLPE